MRERGTRTRPAGAARLPGRPRERGQSSMEYTIVVFFAVLVLIIPDENGDVAIIQVANALKTFYTAFAYAISLSTNIMPL
jgi:uncharacterized protein (UPF0333 family)